jgi:hypothetical protein
MQGFAPSAIFLFEDFRLDRSGGLFRSNGAGTFEPVGIGSRALDILYVLIERAVRSSRRTRSSPPSGPGPWSKTAT